MKNQFPVISLCIYAIPLFSIEQETNSYESLSRPEMIERAADMRHSDELTAGGTISDKLGRAEMPFQIEANEDWTRKHLQQESTISFVDTKQYVAPVHYFSCFENLYLDTPDLNFFTLGGDAQIGKSLYTAERRGFSLNDYADLPPSLADQPLCLIPDTSVIMYECSATAGHIRHFFHTLEHLLGIWHYGGGGDLCDSVSLCLIASNGSLSQDNWRGDNDIVFHICQALFPYADVLSWPEFIQKTSDKTVCFERALTSDRNMQNFPLPEPYPTDRMLGGYFEYLTKNSLDDLASAVWKYAGVEQESSISDNNFTVTYVARRQRHLSRETETELLEAIRQLPNVTLQVVDFAELSFKEQIAIVAKSNVLLGAHGNGLSHALFLPEGGTLIEFFPPDFFRVEYRIFAKARELNYFGYISGRGWISDEEIEQRGYFGSVDKMDFSDIDVPQIIHLLQKLTQL